MSMLNYCGNNIIMQNILLESSFIFFEQNIISCFLPIIMGWNITQTYSWGFTQINLCTSAFNARHHLALNGPPYIYLAMLFNLQKFELLKRIKRKFKANFKKSHTVWQYVTLPNVLSCDWRCLLEMHFK